MISKPELAALIETWRTIAADREGDSHYRGGVKYCADALSAALADAAASRAPSRLKIDSAVMRNARLLCAYLKGEHADVLRRLLDDLDDALAAGACAVPSEPQFVQGYDAEFWNGSYLLLRDAITTHLADCIEDDDVAEEAILIEAVGRAGNRLKSASACAVPETQEDELHTGDDERIDLVSSIIASAEEIGSTDDKTEAIDYAADIIADCRKLDALLLATIKREARPAVPVQDAPQDDYEAVSVPDAPVYCAHCEHEIARCPKCKKVEWRIKGAGWPRTPAVQDALTTPKDGQ